jgi:hypothetical protein
VIVTYVQMLRQRATLPPGPFPWPIVGNVFQLSKSKPWVQFKEWSRANNNGLLTIWIGRTPTIVCNDAWSASDIMEKRSSIYSSRPRYVVFGEVTGQSATNQVLLPYNDHWRLQRKVMVNTHLFIYLNHVANDTLACSIRHSGSPSLQSIPSRRIQSPHARLVNRPWQLCSSLREVRMFACVYLRVGKESGRPRRLYSQIRRQDDG